MSSYAQRSALVTGASSGLGEEFARQLAAQGVAHLVLAARREDRLQALKTRLLADHPALVIDVVPVDLSNFEAVTAFIAAMREKKFSPDIVINNAGLGDLGLFESCEPERIETMLATNIVALTRLTRWAVEGMLQARRGWICNVGSTAGLLPLPTFAVYAATKAYVNSFSEALRIELHGANIFVQALCPGPVETEFGQVASRPTGKRKFAPPAFLCVPREKVVAQTLATLARGQGRFIPGLLVRFFMLMAESTPRWILRGLGNLVSGSFERERRGTA